MRVGGLNLGAFFGGQPDTPAKLAGFAFAFEHLEIAAYEQLMRVARRAGDEETVASRSASRGRSGPPPRPSASSSSQRWRLRSASRVSAPLDEVAGEAVAV